MPSFFVRVLLFIQNQREQRVGTGHTTQAFNLRCQASSDGSSSGPPRWNFALNRFEFAFRHDFSKVHSTSELFTSQLSHQRDHKNSHQVVLPRMSFRRSPPVAKEAPPRKSTVQIQRRPCSLTLPQLSVSGTPQRLASAATVGGSDSAWTANR